MTSTTGLKTAPPSVGHSVQPVDQSGGLKQSQVHIHAGAPCRRSSARCPKAPSQLRPCQRSNSLPNAQGNEMIQRSRSLSQRMALSGLISLMLTLAACGGGGTDDDATQADARVTIQPVRCVQPQTCS